MSFTKELLKVYKKAVNKSDTEYICVEFGDSFFNGNRFSQD